MSKTYDGPVFSFVTSDNEGREFEVTQPVDGLTAGYVEDLEKQVRDLTAQNGKLQNAVLYLAETQIKTAFDNLLKRFRL